MQVSSDLEVSSGTSRRLKTGSNPQPPNSQSAVVKVKEKQIHQQGIVDILYNFPQHGFFVVLFGILALCGAFAALVFKIDSPMFMQILYVVGTGCGINVTAEVVKHFKPITKTSPDHPLIE